MCEQEKPKACYRDRDNGVRFTKGEHRLDCADPKCRGCKPCAERSHCTARPNCTWHIPDGTLTCGRCLASARANVRRIADLALLMLPAAISSGVQSETANLAGPSADYGVLVARRVIDQRWIDTRIPERHQLRAAAALIEDDDEHHPHGVLTRWHLMLAEDWSHELPTAEVVRPDGSRKRVSVPLTVTGSAAYLDRNLHRMAQADDQDFPLFAREMRKCRQYLEAVLRNDDRPERGAPCPECAADRRAEAEEAAHEGREVKKKPLPRLHREYAHWCDDEDCERLHREDDRDDVWQCPKERAHVWSHADYERWIAERQKLA